MPEESVKAAYDQRAGPNSLINTMMEHPFRVKKKTPPLYTHILHLDQLGSGTKKYPNAGMLHFR